VAVAVAMAVAVVAKQLTVVFVVTSIPTLDDR
jgi:hypothetical protein